MANTLNLRGVLSIKSMSNPSSPEGSRLHQHPGAVVAGEYSVRNGGSNLSLTKKFVTNANMSLARASISHHSKSRSKMKHKQYAAASLLSEELDKQQTVTAMMNFDPVDNDGD